MCLLALQASTLARDHEFPVPATESIPFLDFHMLSLYMILGSIPGTKTESQRLGPAPHQAVGPLWKAGSHLQEAPRFSPLTLLHRLLSPLSPSILAPLPP